MKNQGAVVGPRDTALRYIAMLSLVPIEPRDIGTAELMRLLEDEGYVVNQRTIQRDLNLLSIRFPLDCKPGVRNENRWFFRKGSASHWPAIGIDAALAIRMSEDTLGKLLPRPVLEGLDGVIQQARQTLEAKDKQGARRAWANSVRVVAKGYTLKPVELAADTLSNVYEAITRQRQLSIFKDKKEFVVNPLGLVMRGLVHYLVCTYQGYGDIRITALHRLTATLILPGKRHVPAGFNLDEILASGLMHWRLEPGHVKPFEIEVNGAMVSYFEENRFTDEQQIALLGNDSAVIAFVEEDTLELRQWLLGFGEDVKVRKPIEVRDWLLTKAKGIVGRYEGKRRR